MALPTVNIVANLLGKGWAALAQLIFIPFYLAALGIEAYALVGIFTALLSLTVVLDTGLNLTMNRELAWRRNHPEQAQEIRNLVRSLEIVYWGVALLIATVVALLAPAIADHWVQTRALAPETVEHAIRFMALTLVLQLPFGLYAGGLLGLERQVLINGLQAAIATVRGLGSLLALHTIAPSIEVFFMAQAAVSGLQTALGMVFLWRNLPEGPGRARFETRSLRNVASFTVGAGGILLTGTILGQIDKVILSRMVPLDTFGYYVLATQIALSLFYVTTPIGTALFPRLVRGVEAGTEETVATLYHHGSQLLAVVLLPIAATICAFAPPVLWLWTGNHQIAEHASPLVSIMVLALACNGLVHVPYLLQLAHNWTRPLLLLNIAGIALVLPAMIVLVGAIGVIGAALLILAFQLVYLVFPFAVMHRRLLPAERWRWLVIDVLTPLLVAFTVAAGCRFVLDRAGVFDGGRAPALAALIAAFVINFAATFLATPAPRAWLVSRAGRGLSFLLSRP